MQAVTIINLVDAKNDRHHISLKSTLSSAQSNVRNNQTSKGIIFFAVTANDLLANTDQIKCGNNELFLA